MVKRILFLILLVFCVFFTPYFIYLPLALFGLIYFKNYWEGLVAVFLSDMIYNTPEAKFYGLVFISTIIFLIIFFVIEIIKQKIRPSDSARYFNK